MIDLKEAFDRADSSEPGQRSANDHIAAGQVLVRRRRARIGLGAASVAVAGGVALSTINLSGSNGDDRPSAGTERTTAGGPASAPVDDEIPEIPVDDSGAAGQGPVWVDGDTGQLYRVDQTVKVTQYDDSIPILDPSSTEKVGEVTLVEYRFNGQREVLSAWQANGKPTATILHDDESFASTVRRLSAEPIYYSADDKSTFTHPFTMDLASGEIQPQHGSTVVQQAAAGVFSTTVFDGAAPTAAVVEFNGDRYFALVGMKTSGKDVIVGALAKPGQTFDEWLADVKGRMDSGEDLENEYY